MYLDCFSGASGDMLLGALVDLGVPLADLERELARIDVGGYELRAEPVKRATIAATRVTVTVTEPQPHRHLRDVLAIVEAGQYPPEVAETASAVFRRLAEAEARIHRTTPESVHFHEVGAVDAIVDVLGTVLAVGILGVTEVYASPLNVGAGFVECAHGRLPVPAPATLELLKGVPIYSTGTDRELLTPTGAALITTLARAFGPMPAMTPARIGYGAGGYELASPNVLRAVLGRPTATARSSPLLAGAEEDEVEVIHANLDDMNPELFEHLTATLFQRGALDVYLTPVLMKKGRPGLEVTALALPESTAALLHVLLTESTTFGARVTRTRRAKVSREWIEVTVGNAAVRVKVGRLGGRATNASPEYDDCKRAAHHTGLSLREIYRRAQEEAYRRLSSTNR